MKGLNRMNDVYVTHTCKNSKLPPKQNGNKKLGIPRIEHDDYCFRAFTDIDKFNAISNPPTWKYCPECEKKGFKNPKQRIIKEPTEKQLIAREKFKLMFMLKNKK